MSQEGRILKFEIFRYNPQKKGDEPRMVPYEVTETPGMTLFIALNEIREQQDASLQFDFVCRAGSCGSCGMVINGKPDLACRTLTSKFEDGQITLLPLPGFELIGDLSVNTGKFMQAMSERVESWIHDIGTDDMNFNKLEERMDPDIMDEVYELERCIECGCCVSACATKRMRPNFLSAVGFMRLARFYLDPRDKRTDEEFYEIIGDDDGVFGCMTLLGCEDHCPKNLPLQTQIAFLRRRMVMVK
ncbi:fumarate reductase iron-sulfur subunit [Desulfobacter hydrogenophilus]|uniref:Fumarate reductase iron-sulfur subunit n=1 Tax=Desulfobacter hydrogenophilus TaxID=2291 RepID=A0A328FLK6_9BACT|nr:fumarate reductase iron-sulfur subunit [Desulfobacter hydrogenophilus]NDY72308.1 fumarate reductase iron-sulfur subunit [Desulfobacter hydrogenophilus]QBH12934.1 fumarate reductase iron-sulfur subunit [Desulfobacter hydrogenophilus]RAM03917.1 fumarate reductase iron-sulfur subunit [Desulfobacter hydrogenophilus]